MSASVQALRRGSTWCCPTFRKGVRRGLLWGGFGAFLLAVALDALPQTCSCGGMQSNETNAVAALKHYGAAQNTYRAATGKYATSLQQLSTASLIPQVLSAAAPRELGSGATPFQGYVFVMVTKRKGQRIDPRREPYGLAAVPSVYEKTGNNTYMIDQSGSVLMKDLWGRSAPQDLADAYGPGEEAKGWSVP